MWIKQSKIMVGVCIAVICLVGYLLYVTSALAFREIETGKFPRTKVAYYTNIGPYPKAWNNYMNLIEKIKKKYNADFTLRPAFGVYYDPPSTVKAEELRSVVGVCLPDDFSGDDFEDVHFGVIEGLAETRQLCYPMRSMIGTMFIVRRAYKKIGKFCEGKGSKLKMTPPFELYEGYPGTMKVILGVGEPKGLLAGFPKSN